MSVERSSLNRHSLLSRFSQCATLKDFRETYHFGIYQTEVSTDNLCLKDAENNILTKVPTKC